MLAGPKGRCPLVDEEQRPRRPLKKHRMLLAPICSRVRDDYVEVSHRRIEQRRQSACHLFGLLKPPRRRDEAQSLVVAPKIRHIDSPRKHLVDSKRTLGAQQFAHIAKLEIAVEEQCLFPHRRQSRRRDRGNRAFARPSASADDGDQGCPLLGRRDDSPRRSSSRLRARTTLPFNRGSANRLTGRSNPPFSKSIAFSKRLMRHRLVDSRRLRSAVKGSRWL